MTPNSLLRRVECWWILDEPRLTSAEFLFRVELAKRTRFQPELLVENIEYRIVNLERLFHERNDGGFHPIVCGGGV